MYTTVRSKPRACTESSVHSCLRVCQQRGCFYVFHCDEWTIRCGSNPPLLTIIDFSRTSRRNRKKPGMDEGKNRDCSSLPKRLLLWTESIVGLTKWCVPTFFKHVLHVFGFQMKENIRNNKNWLQYKCVFFEYKK